MQPAIDDPTLELIRMQVHQGLVEHEIVTQALRAQALVSAMFILALGCLCFFLWRRHGYLNAAFHAEIRRHSAELISMHKMHSSERVAMLKQQSLELTAIQMQMLHAFEGMLSRRRRDLASSSSSLEGSTTPFLKRSTPPKDKT